MSMQKEVADGLRELATQIDNGLKEVIGLDIESTVLREKMYQSTLSINLLYADKDTPMSNMQGVKEK